MKKSRLILVSLIFLLSISTMLGISNNVKAAKKIIQTASIQNKKYENFAIDRRGNDLNSKKNSIKTNATYKYYGNPQKIKGQKYICYYIGKGKYIPLNWIKKVNGKNTIRLYKNSYVYNKKGKRLIKLSRSKPVFFTGKLKKTNQNKRYFIIERNWKKNTAQKYYLPYKKIGSGYYYSIGHGKYINTRNVFTINGYQNCSNSEKVMITGANVRTPQGLKIGAPIYDYNIDMTDKYILHGKNVTIDAKAGGPQYKYRIKGTTNYIDAGDIKQSNPARLLPYDDDLDLATK